MSYITTPREYYGALAQIETLRKEAAAYRAQAAAVESFLQSDMAYRSQGVAKLQESAGLARGGSDPTFAGLVAHDAENRELIEERRQLLHAAFRAEQQAAQIEQEAAAMQVAIGLLPEIDQRIIELRYRYRRGWVDVAAEVELSDKGARDHVEATMKELARLLESTSQGKYDNYPEARSRTQARKVLVGV